MSSAWRLGIISRCDVQKSKTEDGQQIKSPSSGHLELHDGSNGNEKNRKVCEQVHYSIQTEDTARRVSRVHSERLKSSTRELGRIVLANLSSSEAGSMKSL